MTEKEREGERAEIPDDLPDELAASAMITAESAGATVEGDTAGVDTGETEKAGDEPMRNTDAWAAFDVQPAEVEALREDIADPVAELFDEVLSDEEIQAEIERLAVEDDDVEKSTISLARRLREKLANSDVAARIADAIEDHTLTEARDTVRDALGEAADREDIDPEAANVDVEAIEARLSDREVGFANDFADRMSETIRDTVADGWEQGKNSREIASDIAEQGDIAEGWNGAERIARQELQVASGAAREAVADELNKVEVLETSGDSRVRDAHSALDGTWKRPGDAWTVPYDDGREEESPIGNSEKGIGCRCVTLLVDREEVDAADYAGDGSTPVAL